ncbi:prolyl oligopeptidase family serine peptidase [Rugamonas sp. FT82W]|uniref:Prolyl oligopeptidase family serine peptidase n=1 Tax=Duganella vulcania TaxID=2692166 RepID=A0A845G0V5_9BURK|nr:lipase family protein [Duganella vulcania]MYM86569.1 prolyl oligopeptidase family serine peptidase [Duganella vulcania]
MHNSARYSLISLAVLLASCGGGGGSSGDHTGGNVVVTPPTQLRGVPIGGATLVPAVAASGATVNTVEPAAMQQLVESAVTLGTAVTGTPTCAVTTYTLKYHTVDSLAADIDASTAIMVPSGSNAACQGSRPVMLYAHGTSALKTTDMANLSGTEARLVAAMFAAQGYIVVAPNYAGYAGSSMAYHAYLDATQQADDMVDALRAARSVFGAIGAGASKRLMVSGYSQGGFVALATQRAMQTKYATEFTVTAAAPMSGPYALLQFGDAIFNGAPTVGSSGFMPMLINAGQRAGAGIYAGLGDVYEAKYATGIDTLLPGTQSLGALVAAGKLPDDVLFAQDSLPQAGGYGSYFGADHLLKTSYRNTYLADLKDHPCNLSDSAPLACAPAQPLRKWLLKNDLRTYTPAAPLFLCGGNLDPVVPFANTDAASAYFRAQSMAAGLLTVLDLDDSSLLGSYRNTRLEFALAKQTLRLTVLHNTGSGGQADKAVSDAYHAGLVAPFCLREARNFFDSAPAR